MGLRRGLRSRPPVLWIRRVLRLGLMRWIRFGRRSLCAKSRLQLSHPSRASAVPWGHLSHPVHRSDRVLDHLSARSGSVGVLPGPGGNEWDAWLGVGSDEFAGASLWNRELRPGAFWRRYQFGLLDPAICLCALLGRGE